MIEPCYRPELSLLGRDLQFVTSGIKSTAPVITDVKLRDDVGDRSVTIYRLTATDRVCC